MSKWYEVTMQVLKTVVVEVNDDEDENDAIEIAQSEASFRYDEDDTFVSAELIPASERLELAKAFANKLVPLPK